RGGGRAGCGVGGVQDGVIDGLCAGAREGFVLERDKTEIRSGTFYSRQYGGTALWFEFFTFGEEQTGAKKEISRVPQITFLQVTFRRRLVRLFDEFIDCKNVWADRCAWTNVAVLGGWPRRAHAEGNDTIAGSGVRSDTTGFDEGRRIGDYVIGGESNNNWIIGALLGRIGGTRRNCGAGIAAHRLEDDIGLSTNFRQLLGHQKTILRIGDNDRSSE